MTGGEGDASIMSAAKANRQNGVLLQGKNYKQKEMWIEKWTLARRA